VSPGITQSKDYLPNNRSNTDVVGPEILACSRGHGTHQFAPPSVEISDQQIAEVVTFVRSAWNNHASEVRPSDVARRR
jgi:mono/diheme cytochrome c family protein